MTLRKRIVPWGQDSLSYHSERPERIVSERPEWIVPNLLAECPQAQEGGAAVALPSRLTLQRGRRHLSKPRCTM